MSQKRKKIFTSKTIISKIQIFSCVDAVNGIRFVCSRSSMRMKHGAGLSVAEVRLALSSSALLEALSVALSHKESCVAFYSFPENHLRAWGLMCSE